MRREEKYEYYLHKGHYFIAQKNYEEAKAISTELEITKKRQKF